MPLLFVRLDRALLHELDGDLGIATVDGDGRRAFAVVVVVKTRPKLWSGGMVAVGDRELMEAKVLDAALGPGGDPNSIDVALD